MPEPIASSIMSFALFFKAVHGHEPFPWQAMLAEQLADTGRWPAIIDLPTASGKTAVIDIAVWHLATQAGLEACQRTAPRRIWFVVDRRIVVDEAYRRADKIARKLNGADQGPPILRDMAHALRRVSGFDDKVNNAPPLTLGRLRGGIIQDNGWAMFPSMPAVLTSTVDQFGSRLLFRGYGLSRGMWPIHAALAGNDSLLILDEAHLAEPLVQTLEGFQRYRGTDEESQERWADDPIRLPWQMTRMSATPPPGEYERFPASPAQREEALDHEMLRQRTQASKRVRLIPVSEPKATKKRPPDACAADAATQAAAFVKQGCQRVAVMMNRVDAATAAHHALAEQGELDIQAVLLTGRMRPYDRERQLEQYNDTLQSGSEVEPEKPLVLVTTQCLEVGADFSFDALVTECASLDALRQRFGRLDRLGKIGATDAVILAWHGDTPEPDKLDDNQPQDPIYGNALARTWHWLNENAADSVIDLGITALDNALRGVDVTPMLPPRPNAPVLMPAYLDAWCQTGPPPHAEAEPSLFLHGLSDTQADVQVAFRDDFHEDLNDDQWADIVRLMPPVAGELLTVRLSRLKAWLRHDKTLPDDSDVEGVADSDASTTTITAPPDRWVRYAGIGDETALLREPDLIRPGDTLVFGASEFDHIPVELGHGEQPGQIDVYEPSLIRAGKPARLRLSRKRLEQWREAAASDAARAADDADSNPVVSDDEFDALLAWLNPDEEQPVDQRSWAEVCETVRKIAPASIKEEVLTELQKIARIMPHPGGFNHGCLLEAHATKARPAEIDPYADDADGLSLIGQPVTLEDHQQQVTDIVRHSAVACIPDYAKVLIQAAQWHDEGKREPRFQALLHNQSFQYFGHDIFAKSARGPSHHDRALRKALEINGFRHEMLSMQRIRSELKEQDDLLLHLIASHHGHARPFAPVFVDDAWSDPPPHHLASGVADRFWLLTRRHGWWGLAYLEAILRLADHHASHFPRDSNSKQQQPFAATTGCLLDSATPEATQP